MSWVVLLSDLGTSNVDELAEHAGLSRSERARVRSMRERQVKDWSWLARRRARTRRYSVRETYLGRLLADDRFVRSGVSALRDFGVGLTPRAGTAEGYVDHAALAGIESDYLLRADLAGGLIIHVVESQMLLWRSRAAPAMTEATVGVDLAESDDPRTRRVGYDLLRALADV